MTALVYGFVRAASDGWSDRGTLASFAAGALLLAAFVLTELRAEQPITPLRLFASRQRSGAYAARVLVAGGMFSTFFFLTQYLQGVRGYSALQAGLAFLPMTAVMFAMGRVVPRLTPALRQHAGCSRAGWPRRGRPRLAEPRSRRARTTSRRSRCRWRCSASASASRSRR